MNSAAATAAQSRKKKEEIVIDIEGKPADNFIPPLTGSLSTQSSNCENHLQNNNLVPFEFSLLVQDVLGYLIQSFVKSTIMKNRCGSTDFLIKVLMK